MKTRKDQPIDSNPFVPTQEEIAAVTQMQKGIWFGICDLPIQRGYKTLIYLLTKQPIHGTHILIAENHYVWFNDDEGTSCSGKGLLHSRFVARTGKSWGHQARNI